MNKKAFIFDFDGVVVDSEPSWEIHKEEMYKKIYGESVCEKMGSTIGINIEGIHEIALSCGANTDKQVLIDEFYARATKIYKEAPLTLGIDEVGAFLTGESYVIGIVSASPLEWIKTGLERTQLKDYVSHIISLHDSEDLRHKPFPDGYLAMMKALGVSPEKTIVLEDSNAGIQSAKAAGAMTIAYQGNLTEAYVQKGADLYIKTLNELSSYLSSKNMKER